MFYNRSENEPSPDLHSLKMISRTDPVIPENLYPLRLAEVLDNVADGLG